MATLEQIGEALKRADAAGNVEDAKKLAQAYAAMKGQQGAPAASNGPPPGAAPGSRAYAEWAAQQARAGKALPQVSQNQPAMNGPLDKVDAAYTSALDAVPIAGPYLKSGVENLRAGVQGMTKQQVDQETAAKQAANPISSGAGMVAGNVLPFLAGGEIPVVGRALGMTGGLASRIGFGALSGSAITGADALARGKSAQEAGQDAMTGGIVGGALPIAAKGFGLVKDGVVGALRGSAAGEGQGVAAGLKDTASQMFETSKASGVRVSPESFSGFAEKITRDVAASGLDKSLHPDTYAALTNILNRRGRAMTFGELHIVRQIAQDASMSQLSRDGTKAGRIVHAIDNYVQTLKPSDLVSNGGKLSEGVNGLMTGISTWAKASRVATLEEALYRASNAASGLENGIRVEFRKILNNPQSRKLYSPEDVKLIEDVVRGSTLANLTKLAGKFGFGRGAASNMLGGAVGFGAGSAVGGPVGGILAALGAAGARKGSEVLTERAAQRVLHSVSGGAAAPPAGLPQMIARAAQALNAMPRPAMIAPAVPGLGLEQRRPVQINVPY
jgi:hypothetical protein